MSDKVIRRIPTASASVIQADQRSSHIISSCIDIMDQSDVEAAMKKSESDTELLSGNVINYSLNTLTRSKKISNLEKTDEEDVVKLREKQGRGQNLASRHINQAFDYLRTYKMEPLEESTIITENEYTDLLKNETENDNCPLASNNNTSCGNTEHHSLPQSEENDSIFHTDGYQHHDIVKSSEKSPNKFLKDSNTNFTVVSNHTDSHKVKDQSVTNHENRELCHAEFQSDSPVSISPDCSVNVNENCSESLRKAGDENENKRTAVKVNSNNTSEAVLKAPTLPQEGNISDLTVESDKKTSSEQQYSKENCLNVASPLHDIKNNSEKSTTSTVGVHDARSQSKDCPIENRTAENCDNLETREDEVDLKSLPSSMSDPSVKSLLDKTPCPSYLIQGGMSLRRGGRQTNPHLNITSDDDSSDDDDSGIYAESTRNSAWICVSDDGTLSSRNESPTAARLPSISDIENAEEVVVAATAAAAAAATAAAAAATVVVADGNSTKKPDDNEVFLESKADCQVPSNHKRSESNATTVSENSFRRQFLHRNKKVVLRKDSQTEYQRFSAKFLDKI